ncbi:helix-turn-helix transcriptional regulator [Escherichia coli]|uniref:AraC family transcriptional regulator n=1 Tax=Escherichia coli TaxID=562 RepID=UPI000F965FA0|nr:AraC family transcriptional regulator [Escherichia coli]EEC8637910.1 helix-turn-helix transcriptional regulator [Escherichia coli]EED1440751.1 helix-turn-helix transcriptional regulator [Escherichia coli]EER3452553.1 helix-turn-helix transcriptional regulator [Escherichia coli]EEV8203273.1 helix-turn-helix transcriptional regulator [Escherichia coli]EFH6383897.1 AraC family transcriptional regulator [Escherichia coli]
MLIKNITTKNILFIYTENCEIFLYENSNNNYSYHIPENKIFVIHKNCHFNMYIKRTGSGVLYKKLILSNECVSDIRKVYVSTLGYPKIYDNESFPQLNKHAISIMRSKKVDIEVFKELCNEDIYDNKDTHMLIYLFSTIESYNAFITSLLFDGNLVFTDKVSKVISEDISRKWRLSDIADKLCLSEIAIRKKLEAESSSFNKILTDLRMKAAMDMLVEKHESINIVSSAVGFSSTSYFIKIFKDFFGVTPKQMISFLKKNVYYK